MPRYFFHIEDGVSRLDEEGAEFRNPHAARVEAARLLAEMLRDEAEDFWVHRAMKLIVTWGVIVAPEGALTLWMPVVELDTVTNTPAAGG